jgi:hypothetical protein
LDSFLKHFLRIPQNSVLRKRGILMAGKYSIYKYVKLAGKGWRYARAVYHPNGKIKPDGVLVKGCEREERGGEAPRRLILPELQ